MGGFYRRYSLYCIVKINNRSGKNLFPYYYYNVFTNNFSSNDGSKIAPFNWECDYIKLFFGSDYKHDLNYDEFTQFIQGFLHIYAVQAFWRARKDMEGYVTPTGMCILNSRPLLRVGSSPEKIYETINFRRTSSNIYFSFFQHHEANQTISID